MKIILLIFLSFMLSQDAYEGYVIYTPASGGGGSSATTYLKDVDGSIFHEWWHDRGPASMGYLVAGDEPGFENTLLYYPCTVNNPTMQNGGVGGEVEIYNWTGNLLWEYQLANDTYQHHHDIQPLPNGNILMIAWERFYSSDWADMGRTSVNNSLNQMWGTAIFEIQPNLETGDATVVWECHLWDHLVQDRGTEYGATYGEISDYPELMDINCNSVGGNGGPGGQPNGDWMHMNAISYNENFDQIILSSRHMDEVYIIDHSTTTLEAASHSGGNYGKGGDFLYRWGNPQNYDRGANSNHILADQHSVNWIPDGYPGEGNLILFNNFNSNNSSAVLEFIPPINDDGSYTVPEDDPFGPDNYTWIHSGGFYSEAQGGAFRLPNGNTLITEATDGYIFEIDGNGITIWDYDYPSGMSMIPRAQKYGYNHFDSASSPGDLNEDGLINILDIIITVNIILGTEDYNQNADINEDDTINILDVISILNIILGNQ